MNALCEALGSDSSMCLCGKAHLLHWQKTFVSTPALVQHVNSCLLSVAVIWRELGCVWLRHLRGVNTPSDDLACEWRAPDFLCPCALFSLSLCLFLLFFFFFFFCPSLAWLPVCPSSSFLFHHILTLPFPPLLLLSSCTSSLLYARSSLFSSGTSVYSPPCVPPCSSLFSLPLSVCLFNQAPASDTPLPSPYTSLYTPIASSCC